MAKRGPQSELTDRNWDQEDEPEEAGIFKQASKDIIGQRVIKKAKRRGQDELTSEPKTGAFGGFGGLMSRPALGQNNSTDNNKTQGFKLSTTGSDSVFKPNFTGGATSPADNSEGSSKPEPKDNSSYLLKLKTLNKSVLAWIKQHVDKNPYIILTPIFKDYENHLATIVPKKGNANNSELSTSAVASDTTTKSGFTPSVSKPPSSDDTVSKSNEKDGDSGNIAKAPSFTFGSTSSNGDLAKLTSASTPATGFTFGKISTAATSGFSFGLSTSSSSSSTAAASTTTSTTNTLAPPGGGFSFGKIGTATTTAPAVGFSFGSSGLTSTGSSSTFGNSGFSFGTLAAKTMSQNSAGGATAGNSQSQDGEEEDYVPPTPEVKEIKEEGSLYSKRCKLFYQKEGVWTERGVGNVHIKPLEEIKTQILVRADTNLGNILLNVMLSAAMPTSRQGKNNVLLVCIPNPPLKEGQVESKPVPMLIRVKTGEEADELLGKLQERKALL